ncbi:MAG: hypothetical protein ACMVY4_22180 [Minwuia sp.]|uniref:hypothetical protein n=1 Tax=Minwuia sp. TaxID=2493630 RepID=UPI003A871677
MRVLLENGRAELVWREYNAFTHGPQEAQQYLEFARGDICVPDVFAPYIFRTDTSPRVNGTLHEALSKADFLIVEACSFSRLVCGMYEFQQNYFSENFIRRGGVDFLNWWRDVTQRNPDVHLSAEELVAKRGDDLRPHEEEIIRTLRFEEQSDEAFREAVHDLVESAGVPVMLVSHFSFDDQDNAISALRARNRRLVEETAAETGSAFFDPSPWLAEYGREAALKNQGRDLYHYSPEFDAVIADRLMDAIGNWPAAESKRAAAG